MKKPTLAWVCPVYGNVDSEIYHSHLAEIAKASKHFNVKLVGVTDKMALHTASNYLVEGILNEGGIDYVFWCEMDMILPDDVVWKLYKNKKEICGSLYFLRGEPHNPAIYRKDTEINDGIAFSPVYVYPENELIKVECVCFGAVLLETQVFNKLKRPWFDQTDTGYGQDIYFYAKAFEAGIEVYCDTRVKSGHLGDKMLITERDYKKFLNSDKTRIQGFIYGDKNIGVGDVKENNKT